MHRAHKRIKIEQIENYEIKNTYNEDISTLVALFDSVYYTLIKLFGENYEIKNAADAVPLSDNSGLVKKLKNEIINNKYSYTYYLNHYNIILTMLYEEIKSVCKPAAKKFKKYHKTDYEFFIKRNDALDEQNIMSMFMTEP